jgi:uncharacterized protein (TIGR02453 family)
MDMAVATTYFSPATLKFLKELAANNNRDWFLANKARYEADVREPALAFIADLAPRLRRLSPRVVADPKPVGGSLFRVNRDVRFSKDKSPYKTAVGMSFWHERGRETAAPGYYLHIAPGDSFGGGGVHSPESAALGRIRDAIVRDTPGWKRITTAPGFPELFSIHGEVLKRPPQGYDPDHPFIEDLKRKNFFWHARFTDKDVVAPDFMDRFLGACKTAAPFNRFMARALEVDW